MALGVVVDPITHQTIDLSRASRLEAAAYASHVGQERRRIALENTINTDGGITQTTSGQPVVGAPAGTGQTTTEDATAQVIDPVTHESINLASATPEQIAAYKQHQSSTGRSTWNPISAAGDAISGAAGAAVDGIGSAADKYLKDILGSGGSSGGTVDTSAVAAAAAHAKMLSDKFLADYNAAHPGEPPVATAAQLPPAVLAAMPPAIKAGIAAQGAPVVAGHADASLVDPSTGLQFRQGQEGLIGSLQDAISGKAPSVAALQLERSREQNTANQLGLAAKASGGGNTFLALQAAANNVGHINQGASADAALLRAKEIEDERKQLGVVLDQARGGDITIGTKNADLGTGVNIANANNTTGANTETARLANAIATSNAGNETNANVATGNIVKDILQGNRDAANTRDANQGGLTNATNIANLKAETDQRSVDQAAKAQADAAKLGAAGSGIATLLPYVLGKPK